MESDLAWASTLTLTGSAAEVVDQINANSILAAGYGRRRPSPGGRARLPFTGAAADARNGE